ncbi:MAG: ADP-ribosylation factor-like protein [Candidatus Helarchaeota archaeon]
MARQVPFKIIFAGLANSGKTSILLNLKREYHGEILPTKGIERSEMKVLGQKLVEWDLGGQESFRQGYLQRKEAFYDANLLYFVIDINDSEKYGEALDYFRDIIEILREVEQYPKIIVCLHKIDLHLSPEMNKALRDRFEAIVGDEFDIKFFATTIFNLPSLINAFSYGIRLLSGQTSDLREQLKIFATETKSEAIMLLESNGFIIGEYFTSETEKITELTQKLTQNLVIPFINTQYNEEISDILDRIIVELHPGYFIFEPLQISSFQLYVIRFTISAEHAIEKFVLQPIMDSSEKIKKIIEYFFL